MKKILVLITTLFLILPFAKATHVVGGDLTVRWVGPSKNDYEVQLRVYRSCANGSAGMPGSATINLYDLVTYTQFTASTISMTTADRVINPNIPFGDPCFTPVGLCVDEGVFTKKVFIPDNPSGNGYFLSFQIRNRNTGITNIQPNSDQTAMTFYCEIPNPSAPSTLNNSTPDMGAYPLDAYFCVNNIKKFNFSVSDPDGDSLVYSLVTPLDFDNTNPVPNAAPAFPFNDVPYATGFSLANMVGGTPMTIDSETGVITVNPSAIGTYVFGVKVEEYRNGVKIGETRRDAQYEAQSCTSGNPPSFPDPSIVAGQTIQIESNKETCRDFVVQDLNQNDSIYIELKSPILSGLGGYLVDKPADASGNISYLTNWTGGVYPDNGTYATTLVTDQNYFDNTLNLPFNEGLIGQRFCWTPECEQIGEVYPFQINGFSTGCDGKSLDSLAFFIEVVPPTSNLDVIPNVITPNGDGVNDFYTFGYEDELGVRHGGTSNFCSDEITIEILNRWGASVFKSDNPEFKWDGTNKGGSKVPAGTYFVLVSGIYGNETVTLDQRSVTVLR